MKLSEHYGASRDIGRNVVQAAAAATLPDIGVAMQRLPGTRVKRWGAVLHHDARTLRKLEGTPLGKPFTDHYLQDAASHPRGTYRVSEAAGLPPSNELVIAYSGGPDSFIAWRLLGHPLGVYVDVGNYSAPWETGLAQQAARQFGGDIRFVNGGAPMPELSTGWIPYRNLRLILFCAQYSPHVVLARIAEWGPDKNPSFFRRTERLLASSRGGHFQAAADLPRVKIHTPFGHLTKTALVRRYLQEFPATGATELMLYTRSCYAGSDYFCGECGGCWCRWVAFSNNGINEAHRYKRTPVRGEYYKRLHWADFRPGMVPMYVKRHLEMRGYG